MDQPDPIPGSDPGRNCVNGVKVTRRTAEKKNRESHVNALSPHVVEQNVKTTEKGAL